MRDFPSITDQKMSTIVESQTRHPWRSPVPYLFGGLAAMLGLIAFALLLLACSYWSISRRAEEGEDEKQTEPSEKATAKVMEEKILVIMAGQNTPTFLATPVAAKTCVTREECEIVVDVENKESVNNGESKKVEESSFATSVEENQ